MNSKIQRFEEEDLVYYMSICDNYLVLNHSRLDLTESIQHPILNRKKGMTMSAA